MRDGFQLVYPVVGVVSRCRSTLSDVGNADCFVSVLVVGNRARARTLSKGSKAKKTDCYYV